MHEHTEARELQVRRAAEERRFWLRKTRFGSNVGAFSLVEMSGPRVLHDFKTIEDVEDWLKST